MCRTFHCITPAALKAVLASITLTLSSPGLRRQVLKQAQLSLENAQKDRAKTTEAIATANEDLTATNAQLNDDRVYAHGVEQGLPLRELRGWFSFGAHFNTLRNALKVLKHPEDP